MGRYKFKKFVLPSGKTVYVQGYEDRYLPLLLSEFSESEILVCEESPYFVPYKWYGKTRKYLPDFFIPSENLFIEVKSEYTFSRKKAFERKTRAKLDACNSLGYRTRLVVYKNNSKNIFLFEEKEGRLRCHSKKKENG
ncbi:putative Vsr/MutH/archaeal HJR family endonuclease [Golden Marseillevirus]|uniref:putative Vsr/MutH/archaeal HJR family endonuclease n=1 Tax=Golden Marseillevirus TaxID=1720526 RepID=UPI000877ABDE|nr:putative Vsr/MutH/archaeal HJR family endonuclease [Golden Marseillevirus]ALX27603.1 putative Vsr/MutH/archaeal HJR family endonuclease [Golden Marseillevirus]